AVAFSPSGRRLAVGQTDGSVNIYETQSGRREHRIQLDVTSQILAFHPTDSRLAIACGNGVRIYDLGDGGEGPRLPSSRVLAYPEKGTWITGLAWHPDGRKLATAGDDRLIRIWDVERGEILSRWAG